MVIATESLARGGRSRCKGRHIQAILRDSNAVGLTMNVYVKSVSESQVSAMDALGEKFGTCNDLTREQKGPVN